jgi:hypothetical protein
MNIQQAKKIDLIAYLASLGYAPQKIVGKNHWYLSPFRNEKTASFKVTQNPNRWYDFAESKGGDIIDFGKIYFSCSTTEMLRKLEGIPQTFPRSEEIIDSASTPLESPLRILSAKKINSPSLIQYLLSRKISFEIAQKYLYQVRYEVQGKTYFALGFKNDRGGYELRGRNFKGSNRPKTITFFKNGASELAVFEGFFDFLSFTKVYCQGDHPALDFLILNSVSFFEKSLPVIKNYDRIYLYLDNDPAGEKYTALALSQDDKKFIDRRQTYSAYKDLNAWLVAHDSIA